LDIACLRLEVVPDTSIVFEELDKLQKVIVGVSDSKVGRTLIRRRTDDFPVPMPPVTLLGGNQFSTAAAKRRKRKYPHYHDVILVSMADTTSEFHVVLEVG